MNSCRLWRATILSDSGKFWRWALLRVDPGQYSSQADDLLTSTMFFIVPEIKISTGPDIVESILQVVSEGKTLQLKKIIVSSPSGPLAQLSPDIFAGAAVKVERLKLLSMPSSVQLEAILSRLAGSQDSKLRKLSCYGWSRADISGMDPEILSQALVKLKTVDDLFLFVHLSPGQYLSLFSQISEAPNLRLARLQLYWDVSLVPPEVFAGALSRLERVVFRPWTGVTPSQLDSLFLMLSSHQVEAGGSTLTLKRLKFYFNDLASVSPEVLVGAIQRLERVAFYGSSSRMAVEQMTAILTMLKSNQQGRLTVVEIYMSGGSVSSSLLQQARMNTNVRIDV